MANLIDKGCVRTDYSTTSRFPISLSSGLSVPWDSPVLKLGQSVILEGPRRLQVKEELHVSTSDQKLERITFSEKGMVQS